jgi:hypothetical protein
MKQLEMGVTKWEEGQKVSWGRGEENIFLMLFPEMF